MESVKDRQVKVFLDTASSTEDREQAHSIICALNQIEDYFDTVAADEKIFDKNQ